MTMNATPVGSNGVSAMSAVRKLDASVLALDPLRTADELCGKLRGVVVDVLKRRGVVVGLSGGIDSSVTAALAVRALGRDRVLGLLMPEADSADDTLKLSKSIADALGIETAVEDITRILDSARCYARRD